VDKPITPGDLAVLTTPGSRQITFTGNLLSYGRYSSCCFFLECPAFMS